MEQLKKFVDMFLHLDVQLNEIIRDYGPWTYLFLFAIVFCETGLVVTPILPGDSLLFAAGTFAANDGPLSLPLLCLLLFVAAVLGDALNYHIGAYMGPKVLRGDGRFLKKSYLDRTSRFFEKHGNKTIVLARFVPIVRTFAPFLAGVGKMNYWRFASYNVVGAAIWVGLFTVGGYLFGNIPLVKNNFTLVILGIVFVSVLPGVYEWWRHRKDAQAEEANLAEAAPPRA